MKREHYNISRHLSIGDITRAIIVMFLMLIFVNTITATSQHAYEKFSPTSRWFRYESIKPTKVNFKEGEKLTFISSIHRGKPMQVRWQDTLYCNEEDFTRKLQTQYRPIEDFEYRAKGEYRNKWSYDYLVPTDVVSCKMCGTTVGVTPLGYRKLYSYCTDYFNVNQ